ncbi:MAG: glycosyltransferase family 39 protein, partial [Eudoraea sp.]|nr:glycosyltransferase family 39 protein [Eudoraea sp.]
MKNKLPRIFLVLLGLLFLINLVQGNFTELIFDEAYYWYYAQNLSWGYFDHPPMVALLIRISSLFFEGELGVRFMSSILSAGTMILLWFSVQHEKKAEFIPHFFVLVFSMTLMNAYGFLMLPDTPLLFFTALLLLLYKKFLQKPGFLIGIAMGLTMAALMYSKYHAALVILFILSSNIKLLANKYAWIAVLTALLCYAPHFAWLYEHDFVSIKYHLFERPNRAY